MANAESIQCVLVRNAGSAQRYHAKIPTSSSAIEVLKDELGVGVISVTEAMDSTNKMSKAMFTIMGLGAELERDGILERTATGRQEAAKAGKWVGGKHPPYGYYIDDKTQVLTIHPEESKVVQTIFRWCAHDLLPTYEIQKRLNAMHIPTKADTAFEDLKERRATRTDKKGRTDPPDPIRRTNPERYWHHTSIIKILKQQAYTGTYYYGKRSCKKDPKTGKRYDVVNPRGQWVPIQCPAIVDVVLWEKTQERLANNKRLSRKNAKHEYLFSGKLICGVCGSSFSCYMKKKFRKGVVTLYPQCRCRKVSRDRTAILCTNRQISEAQLEAQVWIQIEALLSDPAVFLRQLQEREHKRESAGEMRERREEVERLLIELQSETKRVFEMYEKGLAYQIPGAIDERIEEIDKRKKDLESEKKNLATRILTTDQERERLEYAQLLAERCKVALTDLKPHAKREIIQTLVQRITVYPKYATIELRLERPAELGIEHGGEDRIGTLLTPCGVTGRD